MYFRRTFPAIQFPSWNRKLEQDLAPYSEFHEKGEKKENGSCLSQDPITRPSRIGRAATPAARPRHAHQRHISMDQLILPPPDQTSETLSGSTGSTTLSLNDEAYPPFLGPIFLSHCQKSHTLCFDQSINVSRAKPFRLSFSVWVSTPGGNLTRAVWCEPGHTIRHGPPRRSTEFYDCF